MNEPLVYQLFRQEHRWVAKFGYLSVLRTDTRINADWAIALQPIADKRG